MFFQRQSGPCAATGGAFQSDRRGSRDSRARPSNAADHRRGSDGQHIVSCPPPVARHLEPIGEARARPSGFSPRPFTETWEFRAITAEAVTAALARAMPRIIVTRRPQTRAGSCTTSALSPLGYGADHIDLPATALGTDKPLPPIENRRVRAVSSSHRSGFGLDLAAARLAPHD